MYFVINHDLKMKPGKIAAQIAHAATQLCYTAVTQDKKNPKQALFVTWLQSGQAKIVLKASTLEFEQLKEMAHTYIVDAGRTQVEPNTTTVLAWYPTVGYPVEMLSTLKLL